MPFATEDALVEHAQKLRNVTLGYIDSSLNDVMPSMQTKGIIGQAVETYFGIQTNSNQEPDFPHLGIELKVSPIKKTSKGWSAKERISITQINYQDVLDTPYESSHLASKTRAILMVFYEYRKHTAMGDFRIALVTLWRPTPFEDDALKSAYGHVRRAAIEGTAHRLSASDTTYIETATKGSGANLVTQPNSPEQAKRRAFCFKTSGITQIVRDTFAGVRGDSDPGPNSIDEIDEYLRNMTDRWIGESLAAIQRAIAPEMGTQTGKARTSRIALRLLGAPPKSTSVPLLERRGLTVRTCRVDEKTLMPYESTSLPQMHYDDVKDLTWETSPERDLLADMVFVVFGGAASPRKDRGANLRLLGIVRWRPQADIDRAIGDEWDTLMKFVVSGDMEGRPNATETSYLHIRPHAKDGEDTDALPNGRSYVKTSYWLNRTWLGELFRRVLPTPQHSERLR